MSIDQGPDYERGFIDGMQEQMKRSVDRAVNAMAKREWVGLTDEDRQAALESLPDMLDGFLKKWGWLHFSKAIESKLKQKNGYAEEKHT